MIERRPQVRFAGTATAGRSSRKARRTLARVGRNRTLPLVGPAHPFARRLPASEDVPALGRLGKGLGRVPCRRSTYAGLVGPGFTGSLLKSDRLPEPCRVVVTRMHRHYSNLVGCFIEKGADH